MPSSTDEALTQEENKSQNAISNKNKKKANKKKKISKTSQEQEKEGVQSDFGETLAPPLLGDEQYLSSSPDVPQFVIHKAHDSPIIDQSDPADILEQDIPAPVNRWIVEETPDLTALDQPEHDEPLEPKRSDIAEEQDARVQEQETNGAKIPSVKDMPRSEPEVEPTHIKPISYLRSHMPTSPYRPQISPTPSYSASSSGHNQRQFSRQVDMSHGLVQETQIPPGTNNYLCGFDTLDGAVSDPSEPAHNVLLVGSEGGLDLCRFNRHRRDVIGRLEGLRGSVIAATILPRTCGVDDFEGLRPLVACIIHGPVIDETTKTSITNQGQPEKDVTAFQTSVEVFSLSKSKHIATLYQTKKQTTQYPATHRLFEAPQPAGDLTISARGIFIIVASGESGEVFVFTHAASGQVIAESIFRCVGKFWTRSRSRQKTAESNGGTPNEEPVDFGEEHKFAIFSLSDRWLAISPPLLSSSQKSIDGSVSTLDDSPSPPGLNDYVSPTPPPADCEVDTPAGSGLLNRVTKQATQEIRKGAQWVGEQGMGMLRNYWGRPVSSSGFNPTPVRKLSPEENTHMFPPTHALGLGREVSAVKIESSLVSIIDLQKLLDYENAKLKAPSTPLATFNLADGCSFLSLSPSGLVLLTTNQVGDNSTVWDLMRVTDAITASNFRTHNETSLQYASGLIQKMTQIPRMSPSSVIDVQWTPQSNRIAIMTEKGTIHLHELPRSDFLTSLPRSPATFAAQLAHVPSPSSSPQDLPDAGWMNNMRSGWQNMSDRFAAIRTTGEGGGLVSSTRQSLGQAGVAARYNGTRVLRNGVNQAWEGAYNLRHASDNKIRLKVTKHVIRGGCFRWLSGKEEGVVSTVLDGVLCTYAVKSNFYTQGKRSSIVLDVSRRAGQDQSLPPISAMPLAPAVLGFLDPKSRHASCAKSGIHGFWTLDRPNGMRPVSRRGSLQPASLVSQDKETCPQYLPFHRHRQVDLYTYDYSNCTTIMKALGSNVDNEPWLFGLELPRGIKVTAEVQTAHAADFLHDDVSRGVEGIVGHMEDDFDFEDSGTVVPTRRSRLLSADDDDLLRL